MNLNREAKKSYDGIKEIEYLANRLNIKEDTYKRA